MPMASSRLAARKFIDWQYPTDGLRSEYACSNLERMLLPSSPSNRTCPGNVRGTSSSTSLRNSDSRPSTASPKSDSGAGGDEYTALPTNSDAITHHTCARSDGGTPANTKRRNASDCTSTSRSEERRVG